MSLVGGFLQKFNKYGGAAFPAVYDLLHQVQYRQEQWGSEYRTSLVFEWLKVVRLWNGRLFKW